MRKLLGIILLLAIALPVGAQTSIDTARTWINPSSGTQTGTLSTPGVSVGVPGTVQGYVPLEPLTPFGQYKDFANYLSTMYKLAVTIGALIAVVMLVTGGVRYMLSESFTNKDAAKARIRNAIWGLTILVGSFLILYTINPNLLNFTLLDKLPALKQQASNFNAATGGSNNTDTSICSMVCPTGYYCEPTTRRCTVNSFKNVQESTRACNESGGRWQIGSRENPLSQYCWLNNADTQSSCTEAGGTWHDTSYFFSPYCYKP